MKFLCSFVLFCMLSSLSPVGAHADNVDENTPMFYNIPTPNATEMMRFGNIPVNYHLGSADISIPLYKYSCGGVDLDVRLQYDSSGLPMNRLPGWTGHGWTLMAGGSITRQKLGFPDDMVLKGSQAGQPYNNYENYFQSHSISCGRTDDISPDVFYFNFLGKSGRFFLGSDGQWKVISDDIIDIQTDVMEPDNYIAPFIDKAYFGEPVNDVIEYPKTIKGFTLVDANGTKYVFGGEPNSIEYSTQFVQIRNPEFYDDLSINSPLHGNHREFAGPDIFWTADTWMLTSVIDRMGNNLYDFNYFRGKFVTQISRSWHEPSNTLKGYGKLLNGDYVSILNAPVYLMDISINNFEKKLSFDRENAFPDEPASWSVYPSFYEERGQVIYDSEWYAHDIFYYAQSSSNEVEWYQALYPKAEKRYDPLSTMQLDLLKYITSSDGVSYIFNYDYDSRIHLDELIVSKNMESLHWCSIDDPDIDTTDSYGKYKFIYNDYASVPSDYMTDKVDYWGYCNEISYNSSTRHKAPAKDDPSRPYNPNPPEPSSPNPESRYSINVRQPNFKCAMKGMLTDIVYPTGGRTHLEYEQNKCSEYIMQNKKVTCVKSSKDFDVAGLRIKSITNYDIDSALIEEKLFDYTVNGRSSGDLYHVPVRLSYDRFNNNETLYPDDTVICEIPIGLGVVEYDNGAAWGGGVNSLTPLMDSNMPHVGYRVVTEKSKYGKSTYRYQGCTNPMYFSSLANHNCFMERQYFKGILLSEKHFDKNDTLLKSIDYQYGIGKVLSQRAAYLPEFALDRLFVDEKSGSVDLTLYNMLFPRVYLSQVTQKERYDTMWVTTTKNLKYKDVGVTVKTPYEHNSMIMLLEEESSGRSKDTLTLRYDYLNCSNEIENVSNARSRVNVPVPKDDEIAPISGVIAVTQQECQSNMFFFPRISTSTLYNGQMIHKSCTEYDNKFSGFDDYLPAYELEYKAGCTIPDTIVSYKEYERVGGNRFRFGKYAKLMRYVDRNGVDTRLLWNKYGNLSGIVQNSQGNLTYSDSKGVSSTAGEEIFGVKPTATTECFYNDKGQIERIINGNKNLLHYDYDLLRRLNRVMDNKKNTLKTYLYDYRHK